MILRSKYSYLFFISVCIICFPSSTFARTDFPQAYRSYMELGMTAYESGDLGTAFDYFQHAHLVDPSAPDPIQYMDAIQNYNNQPQYAVEDEQYASMPGYRQQDTYSQAVVDQRRENPPKIKTIEDLVNKWENYDEDSSSDSSSDSPEDVAEDVSATAADESRVEYAQVPDDEYSEPPAYSGFVTDVVREPEGRDVVENGKNFLYGHGEPISLNADIEATQPGTQFKIELNQSLILEGRNINRSLVIDPEILAVEQLGQDQLRVFAKRRGSTYLHVWDEQRRWTFNMEVILPVIKLLRPQVEDAEVKQSDPLRIEYSIDWDTYYRGDSWDNMHNENLDVMQRIAGEDETPYGKVDGYMSYNKYYESTELISYGAGLEDGKIGNFKDFSVRIFDTNKEFSPLSFPGKWFRGFKFDAMAFDRRVAYSILHGRDRSTFGVATVTGNELRESYIDGAKATFFPDMEDNFSLNYARGYGSARDISLKDKVYSIQGQKRFADILYNAEVAYDEDVFAYTLGGDYREDNNSRYFKLREIDKDFMTITGRPSNAGEVGGLLSFNQYLDEALLHGYVDVYRDRFLPSEDHPDWVNFDMNTSYEIPFSDQDRWLSGLSFTYTPQELSERNDVRLFSNYTKDIPLKSERNLSWSLGGEFQRARFPASPEAEYDRYSIETGIRVPIWKSLSYFWNYQFSGVDDISSRDWSFPSVMNTGVNMSKRWNDYISGNTSLIYRDEERTGGSNSFLAGEDSLSGSVGITYTPQPDIEIYLDTRARNIWAESENQEAYNDFDIRGGLRSAWDTPITWNPKGAIQGYVFKDDNKNHIKDVDESGIENVVVRVGNETVTTGVDGRYQKNVRAKSVKISIDVNTIPKGHVFTTPLVHDLDIVPWKSQTVHFGLSVQTGIYGVVFVDENENGKFDEGEKRLAKVVISLDGENEATDFEGTYQFNEIRPGTHQLSIGINSLPENYLPTIKLKNEIDVAEGATYMFNVPVKANSKK